MCWCTCLNRQIINHSDFVLANKLWIYVLPQTKQSWLQIQIGNKNRATKLIFYGRRTRIRKTQFVVRLLGVHVFFGGGGGWEGGGMSLFCFAFVAAFVFFFFFFLFFFFFILFCFKNGRIITKMFFSPDT